MSLERMVDHSFNLAKRLAVEAGELALRLQRKKLQFWISKCKNISDIRDIVTLADLKTQDLILKGIIESGLHKRTRLWSEEQKQAPRLVNKFSGSGSYRWVIDSIDGTANYGYGTAARDSMVKYMERFVSQPDKEFMVHAWGPMIGMQRENEPEFGVICVPDIDKLYYARKGAGAMVRDKKGDNTLKSGQRGPFNIRDTVYVNSAFRDRLREEGYRGLSIRPHGSYAYTAMLIAEGKSECIVAQEPELHDLIAPMCIVREAGGVVVDEQGYDARPSSKYIIFGPSKRYVDSFLKVFELRFDHLLKR